jgi:hypothetical protein
VTVTAAGTAEYWQAGAKSVRPDASFALAIEDPHITGVTSGVASGTAALDPTIVPLALGNRAVKGPERVTVRRNAESTVVTGRVPGWERTWVPIFVHFQADWARSRSHGSCYVRLPMLTGIDAVAALSTAAGTSAGGSTALTRALRMNDDEIVGGEATALAYNSLVVYGGRTDPAASVPTPRLRRGLTSVWRCADSTETLSQIARGKRSGQPLPGIVFNRARPSGGLAFTDGEYRRELSGAAGCGATAEIDESGASTRRDLFLLLLGGTVGLGLTLIVEGFLTLLREAAELREMRRQLRAGWIPD